MSPRTSCTVATEFSACSTGVVSVLATGVVSVLATGVVSVLATVLVLHEQLPLEQLQELSLFINFSFGGT